MSLRGVIPPLVTPFHADGGLDLAAFESNLEALAAHDLAGYLVLGSNGEAASLEEDEKLLLVAAARAPCAGRFLLVGTGLESTRGTIAFTRKAADLGADAALVLTPLLLQAADDGRGAAPPLRGGRRGVAVPVYLYSVPAFTGLPCPAELTPAARRPPADRAGSRNRAATSACSRASRLGAARLRVRLRLRAPSSIPALCLGAAGGVLGVACCAPRPTLALYRAFCAGDHETRAPHPGGPPAARRGVTATHGVAGLKLGDEPGRDARRHGALAPAAGAAQLLDEIRPLLAAVEAAL